MNNSHNADINNNILMALNWLITIITLSIGLAFYFLVQSRAGTIIGIIMFCVAGLMFTIGVIQYLAKMSKIKHIENNV